MRGVAILFLAATGCLRVEVSMPSVCVSAERIAIDTVALPTDRDDGVILDHEIVQEEFAGWPDGLLAEVVFLDGHLAAAGETADLGFLDVARVRVASASGRADLPEVEVLSYERSGEVEGPDIVVSGLDVAVDLAAYLSDGGVAFGLELVGRPEAFPEVLEFDAELCMAATVRYAEDWLIPEGAVASEAGLR